MPHKEADMLTQTQSVIFIQPRTIDVISRIREEWEEVAEGESLVDVKGSVGMLLAEIAEALGLSPEEQRAALGAKLFEDVSRLLNDTLFRIRT